MPSEQGLIRTNALPQNCFLLLPQGLFKRQEHTSFFKWNSSQADLSSWVQPLTGWKIFLNAMKQTLAGSGKWFLCMKWTVQKKKKKRNILHLWSFPQEQGFPFVTVFSSHYLFNLPETNTELAHDLEGKAVVLLGWKAHRYCRRTRSSSVCTHNF